MIPLDSLQSQPFMGATSCDNLDFGNKTDTVSPAKRSSSRLAEQLNENTAIGQTELATDVIIKCSERLIQQLDALNSDVLATLNPRELKGVERLLASAENMLREGVKCSADHPGRYG